MELQAQTFRSEARARASLHGSLPVQSSGGRRLSQRQADRYVKLRAFEKGVRHSKKKRAPWREAVDCELRPTNPSSLSEYRRDADSWTGLQPLLFFPM